jgi:hypothetical protein|tara:strand:+ start:4091 stop:4345 length:255 start_codon:yes stop_codon:yes gene_type:complete
MAGLKDLEILNGSLREFMTDNKELQNLYQIRNILFNTPRFNLPSLQQMLNTVQNRIVKVEEDEDLERLESRKLKTNSTGENNDL